MKQNALQTVSQPLTMFAALSILFLFGCDRQSNTSKPTTTQPVQAQQKVDSPPNRLQAALSVLRECQDVKAKIVEDSILITEGFRYAKSQHRHDVIEIIKREGGVFTASENSSVPTSIQAGASGPRVYLISGGSFFPCCTSMGKDYIALADAIGNRWIFPKKSFYFAVIPHENKIDESTFILESNVENAEIEFTEEGVLIRGFDVVLYKNYKFPEKRLKSDTTEKTNESKSEFDDLKGLKVERIDENTVRITEGFDYQRDIQLGSPQVIRIEKFVGGVMIPEAGTVVFPGATTAVGITWVFTKEGMTLNRGGFNYTSVAKDASIEFTQQGVLLKSFKIENSH